MNLHLILHKVRGEPAFDIAERCDDMGTTSDPGPWWIIPTSGHRAYPNYFWPLKDFTLNYGYHGDFRADDLLRLASFPKNMPDHYAINDSQRDGGSKKPRSVPAARKSTVTALTIDDLE